jgi:hypothetical protein
LAFSLKQVNQDELKTREFEYSEQDAVAQQVAPQGLFSTMVKGLDLSRLVKEISLDDDFFKRINASVTMGTDLAAEGVDNVAVNFEYPANRPAGLPPAANDGVIFKPGPIAPHTFTCWLDKSKSLDYQYQLEVEFNAQSEWTGKSNKVTSPWITTRARALALDPLDVIGLLDLPISIGTLDPSVQQVQVEVSYKDAANSFSDDRTFVLKAGDPPVHWRLRLSDPSLRAYQYRVTYFFPGNVRYTTDWVTTDGGTLVVNNPFQNQIELRIIPLLDINNLQEADVEIVYSEPETKYERRTQLTFGTLPLTTQVVVIPTLARNPKGYSYSTTVVRADGSVISPVLTPASFEDTALVVKDGPGASHRLTVKLPDTNLAGAGLLAVKVVVWGPGSPPDVAEAIFTPTATADQKLMIVQPDGTGPWMYNYAVTGYTARGIPRPGDTGQASDSSLLVRLPG